MEQDLSALFKKLLNNECSPEEADRIITLLLDTEQHAISNQLIQSQLARGIKDYQVTDELRARLNNRLNFILKGEGPAPVDNKLRRLAFTQITRYVAAACILLALSVGIYFYFNRISNLAIASKQPEFKNDLAPGSNKAVLILANGRQIILTDAKNGILVNQGQISVQKTTDGQVIYDASAIPVTGIAEEISYNTISTPRGGQYQVVLPDGSKVWLNAASSLKFPTAFKGKERDVELTGEAYFEVVKNAAMPFKVITTSQTVQVLGTHFNINCYINEPDVKTTLLEGSVKILKGLSVIFLKPGQQAKSINDIHNNAVTVNDDVNVEEVVAWKNGFFQFDGADINTVMRQVGRWYDVDIDFEGKISEDKFSGRIPRRANASQVLKILNLSGIKFKIEGRKIIVTS